MLKTILGRAEASSVPAAPSALRQALMAADKTQPGSKIRKLPLDTAANAAVNANNRVVETEVDLMKARDVWAELKTEHERYITQCEEAWEEAKRARAKAQQRLLKEIVDIGALEGVKDLNEILRIEDGTE